jgi:hypothetical protein
MAAFLHDKQLPFTVYKAGLEINSINQLIINQESIIMAGGALVPNLGWRVQMGSPPHRIKY